MCVPNEDVGPVLGTSGSGSVWACQETAAVTQENRRRFLRTSATAIGGSLMPSWFAPQLLEGSMVSARPASEEQAPKLAENDRKKPLRLGLIIGIGKEPEAAIARVAELGVPTCQVYAEEFPPELAGRLRRTLDDHKIEATSFVVGGPGKEIWDFYHGPLTIGLVPRETRAARIAHLKSASEFAKQCGISAVQTHCGFIPENPNDPYYQETIDAMREVAAHCKRHEQNFRYETGQETPITLVRAIRDVGLDNQGVNFDLANLILYGKANPIDAIEILAPYIQGIHAKDGLWPANPDNLGEEVPIGKGKVDFPRIIERLKQLNYRGAITIEREISGAQQMEDVKSAKAYLEKLIG
jgi:L-ribulose-5-phosphate 3-epimerase